MIRIHAEAVRNIRSAAENKVMSSKIEKYMFSTGSQVTDLVKWQYKSIREGEGSMACLNIPVGISDFAEIRKNGYYYVDKSGLIEELLRTTATKVTLITRPRRFGKTLGMNMLAEFLTSGKTVERYLKDWRLMRTRNFATGG